MFHTVFFIPLYNALVAFTGMFGGSLGLAVIGLTIIVKIVLAPIAHASIKSQIEQKKLQPLVDQIRKQYPDQKIQSQKMIELYKEHKTNPFAGCLLVLLQLPVIIALYNVFTRGVMANPAELYSFVVMPETITTLFVGFDLVATHNIPFAIIAGVTQFLQMYLSPAMAGGTTQQAESGDFQSAMTVTMTKSMKYTMPVMITIFAYAVPGAVALYWIISNIFMIIQERIVMKTQS